MGTTNGYIFNSSIDQKHAPQNSPEDAWLVNMIDQTEEKRRGYTIVAGIDWTRDNTLQITVIEW